MLTAELDAVPPDKEWHSWGPLRKPRSARAYKVSARWSQEVADMRKALTPPAASNSPVHSNMPEVGVVPVRTNAVGDQPTVASPSAPPPPLVIPQGPSAPIAEVGRPGEEQAEARSQATRPWARVVTPNQGRTVQLPAEVAELHMTLLV